MVVVELACFAGDDSFVCVLWKRGCNPVEGERGRKVRW